MTPDIQLSVPPLEISLANAYEGMDASLKDFAQKFDAHNYVKFKNAMVSLRTAGSAFAEYLILSKILFPKEHCDNHHHIQSLLERYGLPEQSERFAKMMLAWAQKKILEEAAEARKAKAENNTAHSIAEMTGDTANQISGRLGE